MTSIAIKCAAVQKRVSFRAEPRNRAPFIREANRYFSNPSVKQEANADFTMPTLLDHLSQLYPTAKRITLRRMLADGRVRVGGAVVRSAKHPVEPTDAIEVLQQPATPARAARAPSLAPLESIHEDDELLIVNKPAGLLTSTNPREKRPTALAIVQEFYASERRRVRVGLIHRLDRDASGLLVFSKTNDAYESLKSQFFHHTVDRIYLAIVEGALNPRSGRIETSLIERADGSVRVSKDLHEGQRAVTEYETLRQTPGKRSLVRVRLHTGRKHQIRAHLSARGAPIVGDTMYGKNPGPHLMLCAVQLAFDHPRTTQRMKWEIGLPDYMRTALGDA